MLHRLAQVFAALARVVAPGVPTPAPRAPGQELGRAELGAAAEAGSNAKKYASIDP